MHCHLYEIDMSVLCEYAIATYFAYFNKVHIWHIFQHKLAFLMAILTFFVFLLRISVRFRYLPQLSGCQQNGTIRVSGPLWNEGVVSFKQFYTIFPPHI